MSTACVLPVAERASRTAMRDAIGGAMHDATPLANPRFALDCQP